MSNGQGQAVQLGTILSRMGFKQGEVDSREWVLKDTETNSELFIGLAEFEWDEGMDVGYWWLTSAAFFVSERGGRLGDIKADVEVAVLIERAEAAERDRDTALSWMRDLSVKAASHGLRISVPAELNIGGTPTFECPAERRCAELEAERAVWIGCVCTPKQEHYDVLSCVNAAFTDRAACARLVEALSAAIGAGALDQPKSVLGEEAFSRTRAVFSALSAIPEPTRQRLADLARGANHA